MDDIVDAMVRFGELNITETVKRKLLDISPATIDRKLATDRGKLKFKGRSGTKPGSMLKKAIAIRTFSEWDEATPGFTELDLVAHEGGNSRGDYCQTLNLVDVASGWTEPQAVKNKAQRWVFAALIDIEGRLPFDLKGIDSDIHPVFHRDCLFVVRPAA